jgi:hypothetical protein
MAVKPAKTYHEMYQELFRDAQDRVKKARENYQLAVERRAAAVQKADEEEVNRQVQQQEALNADLERMTGYMKGLVERAQEHDETPMPVPVGYSIFNEDIIGIKFKEQNNTNEEFTVVTRITKMYNKSVKAEVREMRKCAKRERFEMAVNFILNFPTESSVVKFMDSKTFYQNRASLIGQSGISSVYGRVNGPGIQNILQSANGITVRMADADQLIAEPIAVAADFGAIWKMSSGAFEWFWYKKTE